MPLVESINKSIKKGLIETFQNKDATLYEALSKINTDLDKVYETLFGGPLPAVDGSALLHINPVNIDSPGDIPTLVKNQGQIAFLNLPNTFLFDQNITAAEGTWDSTNAHVGNAIGGDAYIGANLKWKGGAWGSDLGGVAMLLYMIGGTAQFYHWNGAALVLRYNIDINGVHRYGVPLSVVNAVAGDLVLENQKDVRASNTLTTAAVSLIRLDANDLVVLGNDAVNSGRGHVAIPWVAAANLPAAGAAKDGIIVIDKTNHRLCFYETGARYYVAGTAF